MAAITRTYQFTDGTDAYGSQVETEIATIVTAWNNHNSGTSTWDNVKVSASVANPVDVTGSGSTTELSINNTAADGDPILSFELSGTHLITLGVDDGDGDSFKGGTTEIGTGTWLKVTTAGEVTFPLQPAFLATAPANTANASGDGTIVDAEFDTEIFDQGSDFNTTTFTFTAPVTGRYLFNAMLRLKDLTATTDSCAVTVVTSNRSYYYNIQVADTTVHSLPISVIADMDVNDTAKITFIASGGAKDVEMTDDAAANFFSGILVA